MFLCFSVNFLHFSTTWTKILGTQLKNILVRVCWTACSVQKSLPALHLHFTAQCRREVTVIPKKKAIFAVRPKQFQTWLTFSFGGRSPPETFPEARQPCHCLCVYVFCSSLDPSGPLCWNLQPAPFRGISTCLCWLRESCRHNNIDHKQQTADLWVGTDSVGLDVESWPPKKLWHFDSFERETKGPDDFPTCCTPSKKIPLSQTVALHDKRPAEARRWSGFSSRQSPAVCCRQLSISDQFLVGI